MTDRIADVLRRGSETEVVIQYMKANVNASIHSALDVKNLEYVEDVHQWLPEASSSLVTGMAKLQMQTKIVLVKVNCWNVWLNKGDKNAIRPCELNPEQRALQNYIPKTCNQ